MTLQGARTLTLCQQPRSQARWQRCGMACEGGSAGPRLAWEAPASDPGPAPPQQEQPLVASVFSSATRGVTTESTLQSCFIE